MHLVGPSGFFPCRNNMVITINCRRELYSSHRNHEGLVGSTPYGFASFGLRQHDFGG